MYRLITMTVGNRLSDMEFDEISLVTRPANQLSKVVLFKSDTTETDQMADESVTETEVTAEATADEQLDKGMGMGAYGKGRKKKMMAMPEMDMEDEEDDMEKGKGKKMMRKDDETVSLPSEVYEYIEALEAANAEMSEALEKMASDPEEPAEDNNDILKSADPRIVEIVKAAQERAEAAEMIAKAERNFRLEREFIAKAAEYTHLPIEADSFGKVLKSVAEAIDAETFDALVTVLNAANEAISAGGMFTEVGKSGSFENDGATSEITKAATRLREQNPSLSMEQAVAKAVEMNPSLYNSYLRGN